MPYFQEITVEDGDLSLLVLEAVTDEEAKLIPWYYLYDENEEPLKGPRKAEGEDWPGR